MKYITAVVAVKQGESDLLRQKNQQRSSLIKSLLLLPFDMGWSFVRGLRPGARNR